MKKLALNLENVTKTFKKDDGYITAVDSVNLQVEEGEMVTFLGPSGCGKTTTLRMVAGFELPTSGAITIRGLDMTNTPVNKRKIGFVFQNYALYPHMTVFDNMAFGLKLRKFPKNEILARVQEAAEILEINDLLKRKPKQLSGGQRQRVALGRAIVRQPKVFLFDEPLSNLDAKLRVQMRTEIKKLHKQLKTTKVYVTHDQVEAMTMGDRIAVMKDGIIHQLDTPLNIYNEPADLFVASFIGSPAMNFITTTVNNENILCSDTAKIFLPIPKKYQSQLNDQTGEEIVLGIRPNDFTINQESKEDYTFNATLELVEPLGNETILYLSTGSQGLTCISKQYDPLSTDENQIRLYINREKIHLFNRSTTKRLIPKN